MMTQKEDDGSAEKMQHTSSDPAAVDTTLGNAAESSAAAVEAAEEDVKIMPVQVAQTLQARHEAFVDVYRSYQALGSFLAFVALFLVVLYFQRSAESSYRVQETLAAVVTPGDDTFQDSSDVMGWLQGVIQAVWVDPACGDGECDQPWEFPSYSQFGCRADCGRLIDQLPGLTTLQIDLYWDFTHPVGSIPSSDLMQQATWNLCPLDDTPPSSDCYYDQDQAFTALTGELHVFLDDVPDGEWSLQIKRDLFNKISGAVRDGDAIRQAAYYDKVYVATMAALAEQDYEMAALQTAVDIARLNVYEFVANQISIGNITDVDAWTIQNVVNATCLCSAAGQNSTAPLFNTSWQDAAGNPVRFVKNDYLQKLTSFDLKINNATTTIVGCAAHNNPLTDIPLLEVDAVTGNITESGSTTAWCDARQQKLQAWADFQWKVVRALLVDRRLGDMGKSFGKRFQRLSTISSLQTFVSNNYPEKLAPIFTDPAGVDPVNDVLNVAVGELAAFFVEPDTYYGDTAPPYAFSLLTRNNVYKNPNVTMPDFALRAGMRLQEVLQQRKDMLLKSISLYPPADNNVTVAFLVAAYNSTGANNSWMPDSSTLPLPYNTTYNYVSWEGSTTAYLTCNLADRSSSLYNGTCQAIDTDCVANPDEFTPWNCTTLDTNTTVNGTLADSVYRKKCEIKCEEQRNCNQLCECFGACADQEVCICLACVALNLDAASDYEFDEIRNSSRNSTAADAYPIAQLPSETGRRKLLQTGNNSIADLTEVLKQVNAARVTQQSITATLADLQSQVAATNAVAEARSKDTTLQNLIAAARSDLTTGQKAVQDKLDAIMKKQQKINEAVSKASSSLQAISSLKQKTLQSQQNMEKALVQQLEAIQVAYGTDQIISLYQALELWKRTRLQRNITEKSYTLANQPCNSTPTVDNPFQLSRTNGSAPDAHRKRLIGLSNRLIGGMLLHTWRVHEAPCSKSQFDELQSLCTGGANSNPYGVDPTFKMGSALYDPDLNDVDGTIVVQYYNCSTLETTPTYNLVDANTGQVTNQEPYCAELYNPRNVPWGFYMFPLKTLPDGFPVWFDIDLSADGAANWLSYLQDGLYIDEHTRDMTAHLIIYNSDVKVFSSIKVIFHFSDSGSIMARTHIYTLRLEMYSSVRDQVRFALEIILSLCILGQLLFQLYRIVEFQIKQGSALKYFVDAWSWIDLGSTGLLVAVMILWWFFVKERAEKYDINISYDVYDNLQPDAKYLTLAGNGEGMVQVWDAWNRLQHVINLLNWYYALNGINILLLLVRILKLMHFQPRLGVVTRSLALAGPDLIHFALVFGMVFIGYAMLAHLIFGNVIHEFGTFPESINTCFEILLGNIDVNTQLTDLTGLQNLAGTLFFWSFELLVFMVLLNFLLAIIVDAFSEVKSEVTKAPTFYRQLARIFRRKWSTTVNKWKGKALAEKKVTQVMQRLEQYTALEQESTPKEEQPTSKKKTVKVMDHEVDLDTLTLVLSECLKESPYNTGEDNEKKGGWFAGKRTTLDTNELEVAARYVIERFGEAAEEEEENEQEEEGLTMFNDDNDQLTQALARLADVQQTLSESQSTLMAGVRQLANQQRQLARTLDR